MEGEGGDDVEEDLQEVQQPMGRDRAKKKWAASSTSNNKEALARLMVNEYASLNKSYDVKKTQNREAFLEIKRKEPEQELRMQEYEQR
nr:hypothetical protein [Tanacetum cinerariifolium]